MAEHTHHLRLARERVPLDDGAADANGGRRLKKQRFESLDVVDRAYVLENGAIRFSGLPSELLGSDELRRAYLGL